MKIEVNTKVIMVNSQVIFDGVEHARCLYVKNRSPASLVVMKSMVF